MGKKYLIDTNVLIEYLAGVLPDDVSVKIAAIIGEEFNISFVNKIEILGHASAVKEVVVFVDTANIFYINEEIIERTVSLRKISKIKLPDAILAATAITCDFVLLTRNTDDFKSIKNLKVENPWNWASK